MTIKDLAGDAMADQEKYGKEQRSILVRCDADLVERLDRLCLEVGWSRNRLVAGLLEHGSDDLCRSFAKGDDGHDPDHYALLMFGEA